MAFGVVCGVSGKLHRCQVNDRNILSGISEILESVNFCYHTLENIHGHILEMYYDTSGLHTDRNYRMEQKTGLAFRGPVVVLLRNPLIPPADEPFFKKYDSFNYKNNREEEFGYYMSFDCAIVDKENVSQYMHANGDLPVTPIRCYQEP
jgi:hypothetical protein